ncbi:MAG TPA: hypothetical protein VHH34_02550 [Pseudonocardiaceae bacterium]|nr:hypothetical protein [Pseudonocardiaceae bacterium]
MGTILSGYGEDAYDHEGYPAQVLDDGTITGTHSSDTRPRMIGQVVAACGCGWAGTTRYRCPEPFDAQAEALALAEWEQAHARPVLDARQAQRWERLQRLLAGARDRLTHRTALAGRGEVLERTLRDLTTATELARELHDQAAQQGERSGP